jgi:hypothetical protein
VLQPLHNGQSGTVWLVLDVEPTTYRFRLLNGLNALRTYRLVLTREGEPDHERITQIGSEGGLPRRPSRSPSRVRPGVRRARGSPGRLSDLAPGTGSPWNTATAPFGRRRADLPRGRAGPISTAYCPTRRRCAFASAKAAVPDAARPRCSRPISSGRGP